MISKKYVFVSFFALVSVRVSGIFVFEHDDPLSRMISFQYLLTTNVPSRREEYSEKNRREMKSRLERLGLASSQKYVPGNAEWKKSLVWV